MAGHTHNPQRIRGCKERNSVMHRTSLLALAVAVILGCDQGPSATTSLANVEDDNDDIGEDVGRDGVFSVSGLVVGTNVPDEAKVVVVWATEDPQGGDAMYKYGEGTFSGSEFNVTLEADPPPQAFERHGFAIGFLALVPAHVELPEGYVTEAQVQRFGQSARHAIIWRAESGLGRYWTPDFPLGYSCGQCAPPRSGESFDSYEPVDCTQVLIQTAPDPNSLDQCNWS